MPKNGEMPLSGTLADTFFLEPFARFRRTAVVQARLIHTLASVQGGVQSREHAR
jgi:hypothetical protein